jgi:hypothetical protein
VTMTSKLAFWVMSVTSWCVLLRQFKAILYGFALNHICEIPKLNGIPL